MTARESVPDEDPRLADALARAFLDDPVMSYLVPGDRTRYQRLLPFYRAELRAVRRRGVVLTNDQLDGAALWMAPGRWKLSGLDVLRVAPAMLTTFRSQPRRALDLLAKIEGMHPSDPHWYLSILGTHPDRQGRGVGGALITRVTEQCDRDAMGAYLESSKAANVPYYRRFGFRETGEVTMTDGPTIWGMWRDPVAPDR